MRKDLEKIQILEIRAFKLAGWLYKLYCLGFRNLLLEDNLLKSSLLKKMESGYPFHNFLTERKG